MFAVFGFPGINELAIIGLTSLLMFVTVVPFWFIFQKAGYPGVLSLLMLIPVVHVVLLFFLAFADWPALRGQGEDQMVDRT